MVKNSLMSAFAHILQLPSQSYNTQIMKLLVKLLYSV